MSKKLFFKELKLLVQNFPFILIIIIMSAVVIYGQCQMYKSADNYVSQTNEFIQNHSQESDRSYNTGNLENNINNTYQLVRPEYFINDTLSVTSGLLPILFVFVGALLIGEEFSNRTSPIKAAYFGWRRVITIKMVLLAVLIIISMLLLSAFGAAAGIINFQRIKDLPQFQKSLSLKIVEYSVVKQIVTVFLLTFIYTLLGVLFALLTRATLLSCFIPLILMYFVESYLPIDYLPSKLGSVLINKNFIFSQISFFFPNKAQINVSETNCYIFLTLYIIILFVICFYCAGRQSIKQR